MKNEKRFFHFSSQEVNMSDKNMTADQAQEYT